MTTKLMKVKTTTTTKKRKQRTSQEEAKEGRWKLAQEDKKEGIGLSKLQWTASGGGAKVGSGRAA